MDGASRLPIRIVAVMLALVAVATANLTGLGIGTGPLLYDTIALPRLVIAVVLTLAGWTAWLLTAARRSEPLRVDIVWGLLGGLAAWAAVSLAFSPHRALGVLGQSERLEGFVAIVLYALVYGLALQVVRRIGDARMLLSVLGAAAILLSVYGLAQYAGFEPFDYSIEGYTFETRRAFATFGNPNFFAGLLVLVLPALGALAVRAKSSQMRVAWALGAVIVASALFVSFTRSAWAGAAVQVALGSVVLWRVRRTVDWRGLRVPIAVGAAALVLLLGLSTVASDDLNVVRRISDAITRTGSADQRALLAEAAVAAAKARPITGYGPDAYLPAFRVHRPDDYVISYTAFDMTNNAHSWPLQFAATLGIPGALLLVVSIALALGRTRRLVFSSRRPGVTVAPDLGAPAGSGADLFIAAAWVGCTGFAVHMLAGVGVPGATVPFWFMLGVVGAPHAQVRQLPHALRAWGFVPTAALTVAAVFVSATLLAADATYLKSRNAFRGLAPGDALELAQRARMLNPTSVKYARGAAEAASIQVDFAIIAGEPRESVQALYDSAAAEYAVALRRSPNDYPALAWLAALQARAGRHLDDTALLLEAQATAQRASRLDRQSEQVFGLATGDFSDGAIDSAAAVWPLP